MTKDPQTLTNINDITNSFISQYTDLKQYLELKEFEKGRKIICRYMKRVLELSHPRVTDDDRTNFVDALYQCNPTVFFPYANSDFETLLFSFDEYFREDTQGHVSFETLMKALNSFEQTGKSDIYLFDDFVSLSPQKENRNMDGDQIIDSLLHKTND